MSDVQQCLKERSNTLVGGYLTRSFSKEGGTVAKTVFIAEGAYTDERTDTYGNGICCSYGAGEFKITVNGEPVAISSSGECREVVRRRASYWLYH